MNKQPIKKECPTCGRSHYTGRSCVKKEPEDKGIYGLIKEKKIYK